MGESSRGEEQRARCENGGVGEQLSIFSVNRSSLLEFRDCVV